MYINSTIFDKQNFYLTVSLSIHPSIHPISRPGEEKEKKNKFQVHTFLTSYIGTFAVRILEKQKKVRASEKSEKSYKYLR